MKILKCFVVNYSIPIQKCVQQIAQNSILLNWKLLSAFVVAKPVSSKQIYSTDSSMNRPNKFGGYELLTKRTAFYVHHLRAIQKTDIVYFPTIIGYHPDSDSYRDEIRY